MSFLHPRSLQGQLALRLSLLFVVATMLAVAALLARTYFVAESMNERDLLDRAHDLARAVGRGSSGVSVVALSPRDEAAYQGPRAELYAVRDDAGKVIAASSTAVGALAGSWSVADEEPRFFRLDAFGPTAEDYYGLDVQLASAVGPVSVTVAEAGGAGTLVDAMLHEFFVDVAWIIPVFVGATLVVGVAAIRRGLEPLRDASALAATIEPGAMSVRLPTRGLPAEIMPLVRTVNRALERLERGFAQQRTFTANAAHELRTPLAIVTASLETLEGDGKVLKLRQDVSRMNRLVDQLLRVARLDSVALDVSEEIDLRRVAADAVEYMAPLAIAQERSIALSSVDLPVRVRGNRPAIDDALRNLIENAITHTPIGTEVIVEVAVDATVSVIDHGAGVREEDRERLFDRFWRRKDSRSTGAGLGLSIVEEIMRAHGGGVAVGNGPDGGAKFTLSFPSSIRASTSVS